MAEQLEGLTPLAGDVGEALFESSDFAAAVRIDGADRQSGSQALYAWKAEADAPPRLRLVSRCGVGQAEAMYL